MENMSTNVRAFVLHSGGIDSATALAKAVALLGADNVVSIGIDYGQRHKVEMDYASKFAGLLGVERQMITMSHPPKSMLTDPDAAVPHMSYGEMQHGQSPTYVPFRNGQLISRIAGVAQGWIMEQDAAHVKASMATADYTGKYFNSQAQIWFGAHAEDAANWAYPDCTPEFVGAMAAAVYIGTYHRVRLVTPFIHSSKAAIVREGATQLWVDYKNTWSCYKGGKIHCGECPTCRARHQAFTSAGIFDPTEYAVDPLPDLGYALAAPLDT